MGVGKVCALDSLILSSLIPILIRVHSERRAVQAVSLHLFCRKDYLKKNTPIQTFCIFFVSFHR